MLDVNVILASFTLVFFAELGDKTQLVAFSMTTSSKSPWPIFLGSSTALVCSSLIAALVGKLTADTIPAITGYLSAGLFITFGLYMLFSKETPPVKQAFLNSLLLEKKEMQLITQIFKTNNLLDDRIKQLCEEEASHYQLFRILLKQKKLFTDDINENKTLLPLSKELYIRKDIKKLSLQDALKEFIRIEKACLNFYSFLDKHMDEEHHQEKELQLMLKDIIQEEENHHKLLNTIFQEATSE